MRKAILYISVLLMFGAVHAATMALPSISFARGTGGVVIIGTGKRANVPKRTKNPVNIPVSSGRFRPGFTESNTCEDIACEYWKGYVTLRFQGSKGLARIIVKTPGNKDGRIYKVDSGRPFVTNIGSEYGDYAIQVVTDSGAECEFLFNIGE